MQIAQRKPCLQLRATCTFSNQVKQPSKTLDSGLSDSPFHAILCPKVLSVLGSASSTKSLRPGKVPAVTHNPEIEREEPRRVAFHAPPCLRVGPWRDSARAARKSHVTLQLRPPFRPDRVWGVAIQRRVLRTWPCSRRRRSDASPPSRGLNQGCPSPKRLRSQLN